MGRSKFHQNSGARRRPRQPRLACRVYCSEEAAAVGARHRAVGRHRVVRHQGLKRCQHQKRGSGAGRARARSGAHRRRGVQRRHSRAPVQALPAMAGGAGSARASLDKPRERAMGPQPADRALARRACDASGRSRRWHAGRSASPKRHQTQLRHGESAGEKRENRSRALQRESGSQAYDCK